MSLAVIGALVGLLGWFVLPGAAAAVLSSGSPSDQDDSFPERFLALLILYGTAIWVIGSQLLLRTVGVHPWSVWTGAVILTAASLGAVLIRQGKGWRLLFPRLRRSGLAAVGLLALIGIATAPQLFLILSRSDSLTSPTAWYYHWLTQLIATTGGVPETVREWGTEYSYSDVYIGFNASSAVVAVLSGEAGGLIEAQVVRVVALVAAGVGFWSLARTWGAKPIAAAGAVLALLSTWIFAAKLSSYRPEAFGYGLMFLVPAFTKMYLDRRQRAYLVAAAVGFVALAQIHGVSWLFSAMLVGGTVVAHIIGSRRQEFRSTFLRGLVAVVTLTALWLVGEMTLSGGQSQASLLGSAPSLTADGTDPTWVFLGIGYDSGAVAPLGSLELLRRTLTTGFLGWGDTFLILFTAVVFAGLLWTSVWPARRNRQALVFFATAAVLVVMVSLFFSLGWETYVPRRTGWMRIGQLMYAPFVLLSAVVASRAAVGRGATVAVGLYLCGAVALWSVAMPQVLELSRWQPGAATRWPAKGPSPFPRAQ